MSFPEGTLGIGTNNVHVFYGRSLSPCHRQENVCDPQGRVHGVKNLRVADAGVVINKLRSAEYGGFV